MSSVPAMFFKNEKIKIEFPQFPIPGHTIGKNRRDNQSSAEDDRDCCVNEVLRCLDSLNKISKRI